MSESGVTDLDAARAAILERAVDLAAFDGWSVDGLRRATAEAGLERAVQLRAFPKGVPDLLDLLAVQGDEAMAARLGQDDLSAMRIRDRVTHAVRTRIEVMAPYKAAAHRAAQYLASPLQAPTGAYQIGRTADRIWRAIGDRSADFNYYTKRGILSGVYGATVLVWFEDPSEGAAQTWAFLDRRIGDVMAFETVKAQVLGAVDRLPDPLAMLATLRYPSMRR